MNPNIITTYEDTTQSQDLVVTYDKKFHDVTNIFPLMTEEEFDDLKKDIEEIVTKLTREKLFVNSTNSDKIASRHQN